MVKMEYPPLMLAVDRANDVQFTSYRNWGEVAAESAPLYDKARRIGPTSELIAEADKIAAATTDPRRRMLAALRLVQDRMRYVALLLGEGAYTPASADEAWEAKFGDCKAKSATLLALLDRLGIAAAPMYTSAESSSLLGDRLPSLDTFDHVIVKGHRRPPTTSTADFAQRTLRTCGIGQSLRTGDYTGATSRKIHGWRSALPIRSFGRVKSPWRRLPFTVKLVLWRQGREARARNKPPKRPKISKVPEGNGPGIDKIR